MSDKPAAEYTLAEIAERIAQTLRLDAEQRDLVLTALQMAHAKGVIESLKELVT